MAERNSPVDVTAASIKTHQALIDGLLTGYIVDPSSRPLSLADLIKGLNLDDKNVAEPVGTEVYRTIREGMQIFSEISDLLGNKVETDKILTKTPSDQLLTNPAILKRYGFAHTFATFAASAYISHKMADLMQSRDYKPDSHKEDISFLKLDPSKYRKSVINRLLWPVMSALSNQTQEVSANRPAIYSSPLQFANFVKQVFDRNMELAIAEKDQFAEFNLHLEGYQFRIMDAYVTLEGYQDKSTNGISPIDQQAEKISFQKISKDEIVGNEYAIQLVDRYIDRLALYDAAEGKNPIMEIGGLAWTVLYDGLPGTGKTSLFRLAMTKLDLRAPQVGIEYAVIFIDQSVKDAFYGNTGKNMLAKLAPAKNPKILCLGLWDDLDMLTSSRNDAQGADNDINNIAMQFLDGAFTVRRGGMINFTASNKPTGLDDAVRNRMQVRLLIDGPVTPEHFAKLMLLESAKLRKHGLIDMSGLDAISSQGRVDTAETIETVETAGNAKATTDVAAYMADEFSKYRCANPLDFGRFMHDLKIQNPTITGRSMKAIMESVKDRCADFDIPEEWFTNKSLYLDKPYQIKVQMVASLYKKITPDILFQEAKRYADSESRYANADRERQIKETNERIAANKRAELAFLLHELKQGKDSATYQSWIAETDLRKLTCAPAAASGNGDTS